jgi:hypothetical protein
MILDHKLAGNKMVGIGGWHCQCCKPHNKKKARRHSRRTMKHTIKKENTCFSFNDEL